MNELYTVWCILTLTTGARSPITLLKTVRWTAGRYTFQVSIVAFWGAYQAQVIVTEQILYVKYNSLGIFDGTQWVSTTHGQLGSTNWAGDDFATVKIVQSIGKVLMVKGDGKDIEWDFMPNALGI